MRCCCKGYRCAEENVRNHSGDYEFGPSGYHVSIGFANPKIINDRKAAVCAGAYGAVGPCSNTIQGQVDVQRLSRTPDQRLYPSGSREALSWTQCWVSLGDH